MKNNHKYITCASFGGTGSSAITDLLKEFNNVLSLGDYEFTIAHEVDGISDLQHYIVDDWHRLKCDEGIYRFKRLVNRIEKDYNKFFNNKFSNYTDNYINNLIELRWNGYWPQQRFRISKIEEFFYYRLPLKIQREFIKIKQKNNKYELVPNQRKKEFNYVNIDTCFFEETKKYTTNLLSSVDEKHEYKYLAFDQLVPPFNIDRYINYFSNIKVIIVDRDPRDLYILNKKYWKEGWIPTEDVEIFIKWFNDMRKKINGQINNDNVLMVKFEKLIYDYENEVKKIIDFIGIEEEEHIRKKEFLNPKNSLKNTRLWLQNNEYSNDIKKIEEKLKKFCYNT